jgi:hypothetical protein
MISTTKCLAITISPKPRHLDRLKQFDLLTPQVWKVFLPFKEYYGRPELTLNGNIHYHFYLELQDSKDVKQWMTRSINSLRAIGNTKIKEITEGTEEKWIEYIDKEKELYDEIFINRQCNLCTAYAPTTKEIKKLMSDGVTEPLDEGIKNILTQYKIKLNTTTE